MSRYMVKYKFTGVSDETAASNFRTDHAAGPYETLVDFYQIHGFIPQEVTILQID
jgi:hypothetical protein